MTIVEKSLAAILLIGAMLHAYGSFLAFPTGSPELVWSVGAAGFAILLSSLCWLRSGRPQDRPLTLLIAAGLVGWIGVILAFGIAIGNILDPRVLYHLIVSAALLGVALQAITRRPVAN